MAPVGKRYFVVMKPCRLVENKASILFQFRFVFLNIETKNKKIVLKNKKIYSF